MRDPEKILIIRFSSLGDVILASPLIRVLRTAYPKAQIDFLVKSEYADVLKFNHHLSSVIELKTAEREELGTLKKQLYKTGYDTIIDIHNSLRSRYLRWFSGAKYTCVINKQAVARFALVKLKWNFYKRVVSVADRYLEAAKMLGIRDDGQGLEIFIPSDIQLSVKAILAKYNLERYKTVIGLAPTSKHFTKRWLPERFVACGEALAKKHHAKIFIFGDKNDTDYCGDIAQMINARLGSSGAESFAGKISLLETAAALDFCTVVVSNDTGVMHLAAARKRKVVALFGSTVREFGFFPYGTESIVVEQKELPCRPCSHIGLDRCPQGHFKCMKDITVEQVVQATEKLLE